MKNTTKLLCGIAICGLAFTPVMAGEHHGHHDNDGLHLAAGIVGIIRNVLAPAPVVIHETVPVPAPVVIRETPPPPPRFHRHEPRHEVRRHEPARHERRNPAPEPRRADNRGGRR